MDTYLSEIKKQISSQFELSEPFSFDPQKIKRASELVRNKYEEGSLSPQIDLEQLRNKIWTNIFEEEEPVKLTTENKKYLAQVAYTDGDKRLIENNKFLKLALRQLEDTEHTYIISQWIHVFLRYGDNEIENNKALSIAIKQALLNYKGRSSRIKTWQGNIDLLFEPDTIGKNILERATTLEDFLKELRLSIELRESTFANRIIKEMIDEVSERFPRFLRPVLDHLKIWKQDGSYEYRNKNLVRHAASKILGAAGIDCENKYKDLIRSVLIEQLGDPRIGINRHNWEGVDTESIKIFKQWLSQRDIEFFFEVVSETEKQISQQTHWRFRKKFWEAYLPYIEDTWVVMGARAERMAKILFSEEDMSKRDYGKLKGADSRQSVFFLRIQGYDIVEYSHQGASRIWRKDSSPLEFRRRSIHVDKFRKFDTTHIKRFIHQLSERYRWQNEIMGWFRRNVGITPTKSIRLDY